MIYPLYNQTCYSLLESCITPADLVNFAVQNEYSCIGIADSGNLHAIVELHLECKKHNLKLVVGSEVYVSKDWTCLAYAVNNNGYKNLSKIITTMHLSEDGLICVQDIAKHCDDIICVVMPGLHCPSKKKDIYAFGKSLDECGIEWYVGCDPRENHDEGAYMSHEFNKPVIAMNKTCFLHADDQIAHDVLLCIKNKKYLSDANRAKSHANRRALCKQEYIDLYKEIPFCLENAARFVERINFDLEMREPLLPDYGQAEIDHLSEIAFGNLDKKINDGLINAQDVAKYKERLQYEIDIIDNMKFISYFLIVSDFIRFAKDNGVPVGPGRGSGVGSLVAWCLSITDIDPLKFDLVFERFLNPGRISMPDFDIDFGPSGRGLVIDYVRQKYGNECVAGIATFGSLSSRAVLKDVGRVMQVPYSKTDFLSKRVKVVFGKPDSLEDTYKNDAVFAKEIETNANLKKAFDIARKLEGLPRHTSAHAAGIIIHQTPLTDIIPLMQDINSHIPLVQVTMQAAEMLGLIKYDFLGLTALEIIKDCANDAGVDFDISNIPYDDHKVFQTLNDGYTASIFQFESHGMTKLIQDLHVTNIEDLIAIVSLYRPGPMDNIPLFLQSKRNQKSIHYAYPALEQILSNTYGVIVYQEQIIKIAQEIAGFSLSEADLVRRNMGKKKVEEMEKIAEDFIQRIHQKQGGDIQKARDFFQKQVYPFANYGFNKAHAAAYAIIGYAMAYLKTYHALQFICTAMTYESNNDEKLQKLVYEAKKMNIEILPPDVNCSMEKFIPKDGKALCSLSVIKNVGMHSVNQILDARRDGSFISISDFKNRVKLNKRELEGLENAGALSGLENNNCHSDTLSLFDFDDPVVDEDEITVMQRQKQVMGFYMNKTPIDLYPIANLKLTMLSKLHQNGKAVFIIDDVRFMNRSGKGYNLCFTSDSHNANSIIFKENVDSRLINQVCCCDIEYARDDRMIGTALVSLDQYINTLSSIDILINSVDDIHMIKKIVKTVGNTDIVLHVNNERMAVGRVDCNLDFLNQLKGMRWSVNVS